jgi:hypothetical protein
MYDTGPVTRAHRELRFSNVVDYRVRQRLILVPSSRVNRQSSWLIDDEKIAIFK